MKNKFSKIMKLFAMIIISVTGLMSTVTNVSAVPSTITVGGTEAIPKLIGGTYFASMRTTDGGYAYCLDINKTTVSNQTLSLVGEMDAGMAYILQNGYPSKGITGNRTYDIYITQTAVWWYLDNTTGSSNLGSGFKSTASDPYGLRQHVVNLVNGAMNARNKGYAKTSIAITNGNQQMKLTADKKYYETSPMGVTGSNFGTYKVTISGAPAGSGIANTSNQPKDVYAPNEQFKILVPASSVKSTSVNITVNVTATGTTYRAYQYKPNSSTYQNVVSSVLQPVTETVNANTTVNIQTSKLEIIKIDSETGKVLAGAKLVLKNSAGTTVAAWTTTTSKYTIDNLADGTYKLYEVTAPTGYVKMTDPMTVTITPSHRQQLIQVKNTVKKGQISILKVDKETKKSIAGAELVLKDSNGKVVDKWISKLTAHVVKDLPNGTYTIEEISAPKGYKKSEKVTKVVISDTAKSVALNYENEAKTTVVNITKIDSKTKQVLPGAVLVVKDKTGKIIAKWTTTDTPHVLLDLENGTYTIEEISAPDGYEKSNEVKKFTIDDENQSLQITFENKPKEGQIVLVPDTSSFASILSYVLGIGFVVAAAGFVYKNGKKAK